MSRWEGIARPQKQDAREYALSGLTKKSRTLWLPGDGCLCVREGLNRGVVDSSTNCIFVERDPAIVPDIKRFIKTRRWKNQPVLFHGELSDLQLPWPLDYAFLDFLGTFEAKTAIWMSQHLSFAEGADLCVTHAYGRRYNLFLDRMEAAFSELDLYTSLKHQLHCYDDLIVLPLAMMKSMFNKYSFEIRWPCKYQDSIRSMLLFRLEKFHRLRGTNGWPDFLSLVEKCGMSTASAKKAWTTRKRSALAEKRSNAARKAWATRRKNAKLGV